MSASSKGRPKQLKQSQILANYYISKYNKSTPKFNNNSINMKYNELLHREHKKNIVDYIKNRRDEERREREMRNRERNERKYKIKQQENTNNTSSNSKYSNSNKKNYKKISNCYNNNNNSYNNNIYNNNIYNNNINKYKYKYKINNNENKYKQLYIQHKIIYNNYKKYQKISKYYSQLNFNDINNKIYKYQNYIQKLKNVQIQIENQKISLNQLNSIINSIYDQRNTQQSIKQTSNYDGEVPSTTRNDSCSYRQCSDNTEIQNISEKYTNVKQKGQQSLQQQKEQQNKSQILDNSHTNKTTIDVIEQQDKGIKIKYKRSSKSEQQQKNSKKYSIKLSKKKERKQQLLERKNKLLIINRKKLQKQKKNKNEKINLIKKNNQNLSARIQKSKYLHQNHLLSYRKCSNKQNQSNDTILNQSLINQQEKYKIINKLTNNVRENQFGIYQKELIKLMRLMEEYPNSQPMYVLAQKILEDRLQYEKRYQNQKNKLEKLKQSINRRGGEEREKNRRDGNSYKIIKLVKELTKLLLNNNINFNKII